MTTTYVSDGDLATPANFNTWLNDASGELVNVKASAYGAKGDGTTDDSTAIQAAIDASVGNFEVVTFPPGQYVINATVTIKDHVTLKGAGPSPSSNGGTEFVAGTSLGTSPMFKRDTGNLTRGGFRDIMFTGTDDTNGGDCISISGTAQIADFWTLDNVHFRNWTGAGLKIVPDAGTLAGNPLDLGFVKFVKCGLDGTSYGLHLERLSRAQTHIRFLSGDNNGAGLLYVGSTNSWTHLKIDQIQSERSIDGTQNNTIVWDTANSAFLQVGSFWVYHNVSGGTNANAAIKETGGTTLKVLVHQAYHEDRGTNTWTYGFDDGTTQVAIADFKQTTFALRHAYSLNAGEFSVPSFTDANRGAAGTAGRIIFNTNDGQLNIDDGTNWTLPDGTTT